MQLSFLSEVDTANDATTERIEAGDFWILLDYLDRNIDLVDSGLFWNVQTSHYKVRGGYVWRLISPAGLVAKDERPEPDREVAIACAKINAKVYGKSLNLRHE